MCVENSGCEFNWEDYDCIDNDDCLCEEEYDEYVSWFWDEYGCDVSDEYENWYRDSCGNEVCKEWIF